MACWLKYQANATVPRGWLPVIPLLKSPDVLHTGTVSKYLQDIPQRGARAPRRRRHRRQRQVSLHGSPPENISVRYYITKNLQK